MGFNKATFATRAVSAIVFAGIMLVGFFVHQWSFYLLFLLIHILAWREYQQLISKITPSYAYTPKIFRAMPIVFGCGFMCYCIQAYDTSVFTTEYFSLRHFGLGIMLAATLIWLVYFLKEIRAHISHLKLTLIGLIFIALPLGLLVNIRSSFDPSDRLLKMDTGLSLVLVLLISIWINDTMQYIVGTLIGKTPFSKISPNKTWEGTLGGILLCIIVMTLFGYVTDLLPVALVGIIAATAGIFGTIGDLVESKLKRLAKVKDSGTLLPGHGGVLDRFDSFIFSVPFVWIIIFIWQRTI